MPLPEILGAYSRDCLELFDTLELSDATKTAIIGAEDSMFTPVGEVTLLGESVHAGIKKRHVWEAGTRVARELYLADRLLAHYPNRVSSLPAFTYPVRREDDRYYLGILTEDFTRNGDRALYEVKNDFGLYNSRAVPEGLHQDVYEALDCSVYAEAFRHMAGFVFDGEVLIDYDDVAYTPSGLLEEYKALVDGMTITLE